MKRLLTDTQAKNAKPLADGKQRKIADGGGLYLLLKPNGVKLWRFKFRLAGKEQLLALGQYPQVNLAQARKAHDQARVLVAKGEHPRIEREVLKLKKLHEGADTFKGIATEWMESKAAHRSAYYAKQIQRSMDVDVFPVIGALPIRQVTALHLRTIIKKVQGRGAEIVAENIRQWCSAIFRYAMVNGRADADPAPALKGLVQRPPIKHNVALNDSQMVDFLKRLGAGGGNRTTRIALELLLLTFVRTVELRKATWVEFSDKEEVIWRIPAERMKMGVEHLVPLSKQAKSLIEELRTITGSSHWLFPNYRRPDDCMTATTLNRALERMGLNGKGTIGFSAHGFRGTASTALHEAGFPSEAIERQLAHAEKNKVKAAYNQAQHREVRIALMQAWADKIDKLRAETARTIRFRPPQLRAASAATT